MPSKHQLKSHTYEVHDICKGSVQVTPPIPSPVLSPTTAFATPKPHKIVSASLILVPLSVLAVDAASMYIIIRLYTAVSTTNPSAPAVRDNADIDPLGWISINLGELSRRDRVGKLEENHCWLKENPANNDPVNK